MKTKKRFISWLLTAVILMGMFPAQFAQAEWASKENTALRLESGAQTTETGSEQGTEDEEAESTALAIEVFTETKSAAVGDTIDFTVYLIGANTLEGGICGGLCWLDIPGGLTVTAGSLRACNDTGLLMQVKEDRMVIVFAGSNGFKGEKGALATFSCTVNETVKGDLEVGFLQSSKTCLNGDQEDFYLESGKFALRPASIAITGLHIASGICGADGDNLTWTLHLDGTLTISGEGEMKDYAPEPAQESDRAPWNSYAQDIKEIVIGEEVTSIGSWAFAACDQVTAVKIPAAVGAIGQGALPCSSLAEITVESGNQAFASRDGVLFSGDMTNLIRYPSQKTGTSYEIPDSVTEISPYAFSGCAQLAQITIPAGMERIGVSSFEGCAGLEKVHFSGTKSQWGALAVAAGNEMLLNAQVLFAQDDESEDKMGDVSSDGRVTARDAILILEAIAGKATSALTEERVAVADVDRNGVISVRDAVMILCAIAAGTTDQL